MSEEGESNESRRGTGPGKCREESVEALDRPVRSDDGVRGDGTVGAGRSKEEIVAERTGKNGGVSIAMVFKWTFSGSLGDSKVDIVEIDTRALEWQIE